MIEKTYDKLEEFARLAKPLHEWMLKNYDPHCKIVIEWVGATVESDLVFVPLDSGD